MFTLILALNRAMIDSALSSPADRPASPTARWLGEVPIYAIGAVLMGLCIALLAAKGVPPSLSGAIDNTRIFALFVVLLGAWDAARQLYRHRPPEPLAHLKARYASPAITRPIVAGLPMLGIAIVLLPFFSKMKAAIPLFTEYSWDAAFIAWDRAIFFGLDAWQVLQPMLGYPVVTAALALLYQLWFLLLYPGVLFFAFARLDPVLRRRFFLSYILAWTVIGGAMATALASVGPVFLEPLIGDPTFAPQMAYLYAANQEVPIMVLPVQEMLLDWFGKSENGLGSGITAMPSMHCAIAFLYWLAMRRVDRAWGLFFGVFAAITWISSVHLAYHYAVDGLVSLFAILAIWRVSGWIIAAWDRWLARRAQPALLTNTVPAE